MGSSVMGTKQSSARSKEIRIFKKSEKLMQKIRKHSLGLKYLPEERHNVKSFLTTYALTMREPGEFPIHLYEELETLTRLMLELAAKGAYDMEALGSLKAFFRTRKKSHDHDIAVLSMLGSF